MEEKIIKQENEIKMMEKRNVKLEEDLKEFVERTSNYKNILDKRD